jgi:hypothetical protein
MSRFFPRMLVVLGVACCVPPCVAEDNPVQRTSVRQQLERELPLLGHRNWIVIADMAYPAQVSPGIETIYVGGNHLDAIREMLEIVGKASHVRPVIHIDKELKAVAEDDAPGIRAFREGLKGVLKTEDIVEQMHEDTIAQLNEAGKLFKVLVLKTDSTLPYTTVFVRLECGYWSDAAEQRLRESLKKSHGRNASGTTPE